MRVLIVDDERRARERLARLLKGTDGVEVVGDVGTGTDALEALTTQRPDAVFLDVEMPGMNGFDVLQALPTVGRPWVVFVTAYDEHALKAFDVSAVDYLVKPVTEERLERAVARLRERDAGTTTQESAVTVGPPLLRIIGRRLQKYYVLPIESVEAFVAEQTLVFAVTSEGRFLVDITLKDLEGRLDHTRFARVHKGAVLNLSHLREIEPVVRGGATARLQSGRLVAISRRYAQSLRQALGW